MARTYEDCMTLARDAFAKGFTSEAARKGALEWINSAMSVLHRTVTDSLLANREESEEWNRLYWDMPHGAHGWTPKRAKQFESRFPAVVVQANACAALRAEVKAAAIVAKTPRAKTAKEIAKEAHARTCQVCGRPIFAETGVIAHHGYTRPGDGWQTPSCWGARELPFEVSRDALGRYIAYVAGYLARRETARADVAAERSPVPMSYETVRRNPETGKAMRDRYGATLRDVTHFALTRANIADMEREHGKAAFPYGVESFDHYKAKELATRDTEIKSTREHVTAQRARFDAWKQTQQWNKAAKQWESVA